MCYQISHNCAYCSIEYICKLSNKICPTINADDDKNMCDECRAELESALENERNLQLIDFLRSKRDKS